MMMFDVLRAVCHSCFVTLRHCINATYWSPWWQSRRVGFVCLLKLTISKIFLKTFIVRHLYNKMTVFESIRYKKFWQSC